jgi:predicted nucleic acid-binding protein
VELAVRAVHLDALGRYRRTRLHSVDCAIAATAAAEGVSVATLDRGFKKFPDVRIDVY